MGVMLCECEHGNMDVQMWGCGVGWAWLGTTDHFRVASRKNLKSAFAEEGIVHGIEDVELMFSANVGSPQHPITQIASGGERSRIMLAFKAAIATKSTVPTIVLDEIDTGVSGDVASRMAGAMKRMSQGQQVFSVTHLAQVAAKGDSHLEITKHSDSTTTSTHAQFLHEEECTEAIAKMLSGSSITEEARAQARVLRTSNQ